MFINIRNLKTNGCPRNLTFTKKDISHSPLTKKETLVDAFKKVNITKTPSDFSKGGSFTLKKKKKIY
jgi:hypothetical protein